MRRTLMAFSGGLDSGWLLYSLLKKTDDLVHCFQLDLSHIMCESPDGPVPFYHDAPAAERAAAQAVVDWLCKNVRPVTLEVVEGIKYEPEPDDYPKGNSNGWRVLPMMKVAAARMKDFDRFVYAKSPENIRTADYKLRDDWNQKWWAEYCPGTTFELPLIASWEGRPHALKNLPAGLKAIVLSCDASKILDGIPQNCGICEKCILTRLGDEMIRDGVDPDKALDMVLFVRKAGRYVDPKAGDRAPPFPAYTK